MFKIVSILLLIFFAVSGVFFIANQDSNDSQAINTQQDISQSDLSQNTPTTCSRKPLIELTEGPYYKSDSPERQNITEENTPGDPLILEGYVLDTNCEPIDGAWLDFWQANGEGNYDNSGFNLRGHQYTDEKGYYKLETVLPTRYTGRTEHIHFKIKRSENSPIITSQLFFPNSSSNSTDSIFDDSLVVEISENTNDINLKAYYNFIIE